jgi:uncharacterized ferritin-like protein (DUF455 family)
MEWFGRKSVHEKLAHLEEAVALGLGLTSARPIFELGRDARVVSPSELPPKPGLSTREGQARLLHDLGSIELQAMELAVRSLYEYPEAPREFRDELARLALEEGAHLRLCLKNLEALGFEWGHWDVHLALWSVVAVEDSLLDRVLIVHRYLEGSGLDAGDSILRRLSGVPAKDVREAVGVIVSEEVGHVKFGTLWFRTLCEREHLDPEVEFARRIGTIARKAPRRERLARELRLRGGFTESELRELEKHTPS